MTDTACVQRPLVRMQPDVLLNRSLYMFTYGWPMLGKAGLLTPQHEIIITHPHANEHPVESWQIIQVVFDIPLLMRFTTSSGVFVFLAACTTKLAWRQPSLHIPSLRLLERGQPGRLLGHGWALLLSLKDGIWAQEVLSWPSKLCLLVCHIPQMLSGLPSPQRVQLS